MPSVVEIRELAKRYGRFTALHSLSLDIPAASVFALLGPNGAGKTTIIKLIMGMLQPSAGSVRVCGLDAFADGIEAKTRIGYLPDEPVFYDFMRGHEIVRFAGEMHGLDLGTIRSRSAALADRLQLADALDEFAENYSRGMKKKLGLIVALLHEPELVILDEPTNGLDPHGTHVLHALMRETAAAGRTVMFSTHLLDQAERLCDRVAVVHHGRLAAEGTLADLRTRFTAGEESTADAAGLGLEELFFKLTESAVDEPPAEPTTTNPAPATKGS